MNISNHKIKANKGAYHKFDSFNAKWEVKMSPKLMPKFPEHKPEFHQVLLVIVHVLLGQSNITKRGLKCTRNNFFIWKHVLKTSKNIDYEQITNN